MKRISKSTFLCLLLLVFCFASSAGAASFSADMVTTEKGETQTQKFYLSGPYYRMEIIEAGKPMVIIADREKKVHRILNMGEKVFFELPSNDFRILTNDPFKASEYMVSEYGSTVEGTEKINGVDCEKQVVPSQDTKLQSRWFSKELDFPVKIVSYAENQAFYVAELTGIENVAQPMDLFTPPADFTQVEEPGAAEKRKREEQKKAEAALPGLAEVGTAQAPCYIKIAAGGELHIVIDTDREAFLEVTNRSEEGSEYTLQRYRNQKPSEVYDISTRKLDRNGHETFDFNDDFAQGSWDSLVDEVVIKVNEGLVYAYMRQRGKNRKDFYNRGNLQNGAEVDPKRPFKVLITGDNPFGPKTTGKFYLGHESGGKSDVVPFTVENGKTLTWEYPASKGVNGLDVTIKEGDGRAKISMIQPPVPEKTADQKPEVKKEMAKKYTPKPKTINAFTVSHPYGTSKPVEPGRDLVITVTGISDDANGRLDLYTDRQKTKKIEELKFKLKTGQEETFILSGEKNVGWVTVWVSEGSFKVILDQSPGVKAKATPKESQTPATPVVKAESPAAKSIDAAEAAVTPPAAAVEPPPSNATVLKGEAPLMAGAKVVKETDMGNISRADIEVPASPQDVVDFYKQAMTARGWQAGMTMVQGPMGVLQLSKGNRQITVRAAGEETKSIVNIVVMGK